MTSSPNASGQDELADVVQEAGDVCGLAVDAAGVGRRGRGDGHRDRVDVHLPADRPPLPGARSRKRYVAASRLRRRSVRRPTSMTAWRMLFARTGRASAAEFA